MSAVETRVLLIGAHEPSLRHLTAAIHAADAPFLIEHARDVAHALRRLSGERFDALLLDLSGPAADADVPGHLLEHAPDVPFVVITRSDDDVAVRALKSGAQDSLPITESDGPLLVRALRYAIERHQLQMALRAMALIDELTGLYNRRGLQTLSRQYLRMADRLRKRVSHIFVDLDDLKAINDAFGHREGDRALVETAELLRETFRESDILARIGGDEFVVLALETPGLAHEQWAARLQENLRQRNDRADRRWLLSMSVGIVAYDPDYPCPIDDLLDRADALMYEQKRAKRRPTPSGHPTIPPRHGRARGEGSGAQGD